MKTVHVLALAAGLAWRPGAVIGGVIGAAGGTVVAAQTASRDVVVTPGTLLTLVLREPVTRVAR
jgi:hypothetical protein